MPGPRITVQTGIIRLECHTFRLTFRRTGMSTTDDDEETRPIIYTPMPLRSQPGTMAEATPRSISDRHRAWRGPGWCSSFTAVVRLAVGLAAYILVWDAKVFPVLKEG